MAGKSIADVTETVEYQEYGANEARDLHRNNLRSTEMQHAARRMDVAKRRAQIKALKSGRHNLDPQFVKERLMRLELEIKAIEVDIFTFAQDIEFHKAELAGLPEPPKGETEG